ncbi:MAG: 2-oxo acid dehydrogenase subunit E2 [Spirochaetes bacterium]|nr:2-oxo acid dehydrogenase subunit E2 [Spirochaetota bacterium]
MVEIKMPEAGFNITEGKVVRWYKKRGETLTAGENVVSVETDKITVDVPAEVAGVLHEIRCEEGDVAPVGGVLGLIAEANEKDKAPSKQPPVETVQAAGKKRPSADGTAKEGRKISPAAKAHARSLGVDLSSIVEGSGPGGRIVKADVEALASAPQSSKERVADRRVPFEGWRKTLAERVVRCAREVPQCTIFSEADVTALSGLVKSLREREDGPRITYLPFLVKAMVGGIDAVPEMNAHCDGTGYSLKREINVGIVVNVGGKLVIPVLKGVREKSIIDLAEEISMLVGKTRDGSLREPDVEGGTITVTNVGPFGVLQGTALVFQPQTSIVCMGAAREVPAVHEGRMEIRTKMGLGVSYDHRVLDGAMCGTFLKKVTDAVKNLEMLVI